MLILKGLEGKSICIETLLKNTISSCLVYDNKMICIGDYHYKPEANDIYRLCECLKIIVQKDKNKGTWKDYFIIYTNQPEGWLNILFAWIRKNENIFGCQNLIVTCK